MAKAKSSEEIAQELAGQTGSAAWETAKQDIDNHDAQVGADAAERA